MPLAEVLVAGVCASWRWAHAANAAGLPYLPGSADVDEPYTPGICQNSFPAKAAVLLHACYAALGGTAGSGPAGLNAVACKFLLAR